MGPLSKLIYQIDTSIDIILPRNKEAVGYEGFGWDEEVKSDLREVIEDGLKECMSMMWVVSEFSEKILNIDGIPKEAADFISGIKFPISVGSLIFN